MRAIVAALASGLLVAATPAPVAIDDLAWLSGRWESVSGEQWVEEFWSAPRGDSMFGFNRTGRGGALRDFEYMRLERDPDGRITFVASPGGRAGTAFRLSDAAEASVTFENSANDFPQLIHYRRDGDLLRATISASDGGNAIHWTFRRRP